MIDSTELMELALAKAREGVAAGQSPFGCAIARNGRVLAAAHNTVWGATDITAHAEINALREACRKAGDISLAGAVVASTCEPCPMCMAALHWARVETVYYGATIADAKAAGFHELTISAEEMVRRGRSGVKLVDGVLAQPCRALMRAWSAASPGKAY